MPNPTDLFRARAEARALLWQAGELSLHAAVDELQRYASELGLPTDTAQQIMSTAFKAVRGDL